jgi:thioredoxin
MAVKKQYKSFEELLENSTTPVLVDFYAEWCGPCQMMVPILEQVKSAFQDTLQVVKINTEKYPALASQYGVQALPTLMVFKNGQSIHRQEGALPADQLIQQLQALL